MKRRDKIAAIFAATTLATMAFATSASADDRHPNGTWRDNNGGYRQDSRGNGYRNESRNNNHISEHGRIRSFTRERDGYRVYLDRGNYSYWVPQSRLGGHRLRVGLDIRLGGIFNGGYVDVDALGWPGDPYYNEPYDGYGRYDRYDGGYVSGYVERVDFRDGRLLLRDDRNGRTIDVDMRSTEHRRGLDLDDLRRGDRVTLSGSWDRGYFHAYRIDSVNTRP